MDLLSVVVGLALVLLGLMGYVGLLHLTRGNPISRIRILDEDDRLPAVSEGFFCEMVETIVNTDLEKGNRVEPVFDGDGTFPRLWRDLEAARTLITWHVFWFKPGKLADRAKEILVDRARAGVRVLFLRDFYGSLGTPRRYFRELEEAGVEVATFRPLRWNTLNKVQQRSHTRTVVIDGEIGWTGGFAMSDEWLGDGRSPGQWRDTSVRVEGPAVHQIQAAFTADWAEATGEILLGDVVFPKAAREVEGPHRAGLVYSAPSLGSTDAERFFALMIGGAQKTLYVSNAYFVPDDDFRRFLVQAVERGVDVRVLTPGGNTDQKVTWYAARRNYEELLEGGVRIYEYRPTMVHAKTIAVDRAFSVVGTINFDNRSMSLNDEVALLVQGEDLAGRIHDRFLEDLERADELELESFRRRPLRARAIERLAVVFSRLI